MINTHVTQPDNAIHAPTHLRCQEVASGQVQISAHNNYRKNVGGKDPVCKRVFAYNNVLWNA